ncbi:hypothetical protein EDC04DRAFT_2959123 [Pisolithus marmoratus]|nr:hypothetical protein EDC04DRAFT_2959123 [Pisolithus marmoratus]
MKPNELLVELPSEERLEDKLTKVRSNDEAEAAVGAAQQVPSRSIEVKDHKPKVQSELHTAQSELQEQPSLRAGEPLKSEHLEVLNRMVKAPYEVRVHQQGSGAQPGRQQDMPEELTQAMRWLVHKDCCLRGSRQAETLSVPNDTETMPGKLNKVSNKSQRVSAKIVVEGSLGAGATDIVTSMEIMTQAMYLNQDGADTKVHYQILEPANAGAASCIKAQPAGAHLQPEYSPTWNTPEASNVLLKGEQNSYVSSEVTNKQGSNNDKPQLTIHDPGGYLGQSTVCMASRQNAKTRESEANNEGNTNGRASAMGNETIDSLGVKKWLLSAH